MTNSPRLLAYCASHFGLGHERCTLGVLGEVRRRLPEAEMLMVAGNPLRLEGLRPAGLDTMVLPPSKRFGKAGGVRSRVLDTLIDAYQPSVIYLEEEPAGHVGELLPTLERLQGNPSRPTVFVTLRDIVNDPKSVQAYWRSNRHDLALEHYTDQLLIFGDPAIYDPFAEYGWSAAARAKTTFCGYYDLTRGVRPAAEVRKEFGARDKPLVVVTTGGGADGSALLLTAADALKRQELKHLRAVIVSGPMAAAATVRQLRERTAGRSHIRIESYVPDMPSLVNAADLAIAMAGHNTVSEIVALRKRAILVPRNHNEQQIRARLFAERGLVHTFGWNELSAERLSTEIRKALTAPPPEHDIDFGGLERAGEILANALEPQFTPFDS
jgi:predicted glycosyltransferase